MKLTQRLSLTHGFIALLTVLVTLAVMIGGARLLFWNEVHSSQRRQMNDFALQARESFFGHEDVGNCNFIRQAVKDETVAFVSYVDINNRPRLVLPSTFHGQDFTAGDKNLEDGRHVSVLTLPVEAGGQKVGTVSIGYDNAKVEARVWAQMARWVGLGGVGGLAALSVAILVSFFLARHLVRPLKRIRAGTQEVRLGKLDKMVEVNRSDEIGDLARDFNEMVVKLKELEAMKRDFVAGVSHDFGTPLHAIKNALDMIQEGKIGPVTDKQAEYLLMMSNNTVQLTAFIENLLTSAKIEAAKSEPYYETLDAKAFAMDVVNLYRSQAEKQGIELVILNQTASPHIVTDTIMFRQILSNLVSNAMKYTLKGSITIFLAEDASNHIIKVKDTGIGIDTRNTELIFDKFFRVRQPKDFPERQGSGLGLSITKGLVEAMGGTISLESRLGEGSTFTIRLPRRSAS